MKIYLVGGAVRDLLLGEPIVERDWLVVGGSVDKMLKLGFIQVGKDFPVFLHPKTNEEYALARTEKKSAKGYTGFSCYADPDVSLEEDLLRRDLTINAIALDLTLFTDNHDLDSLSSALDKLIAEKDPIRIINEKNALIDPYQGLSDLNTKQLRHVSPAFIEDPLRVLRLARFAARFAHLGFIIDNNTLLLTQKMSESGELSFLTPERVWKETEKAFDSQTPSRYFEHLIAMRALVKIYPALHLGIQNTSITNNTSNKIITATERFNALNEAAHQKLTSKILFAVLFTVLLPQSQNVQKDNVVNSLDKIKLSKANFFTECKNWRIPNEYRDFAWSIGNSLNIWPEIPHVSAESLLDLFNQLNAFKENNLFDHYCSICKLLYQSTELQKTYSRRKIWLQTALQIARNIQPQSFIDLGLRGAKIKEALQATRLESLKTYIENNL